MYRGQTDETLVMLTLAGETRAYEALVAKYEKAVISAALSVTRTRFMAEDAAQDAFVTAWMKLNLLSDGARFGAWVCKIAKNCARNMLSRYRSYLSMDALDYGPWAGDSEANPLLICEASEERDMLRDSVSGLPEKVREIIRLYYFEELSIAEIADRMRVSEGTVKWQLHDGRKRIRKELCAMNEQYSDTLLQKVMKKVEELKLWKLKNDKSGFEKVYKDVLREAEELPESTGKYHAIADVLMHGWWWLPGDKNDALFARIRDAAIRGKNDEVMEFIVTREDAKVWGNARIDFIRNKQIPMVKEAGFVRALGREWFWLGINCFDAGKTDEGWEAFEQVERVLDASHPYRALVPGARRMEEKILGEYKDKSKWRYRMGGAADTLRYVNGKLCYWGYEGYGEGWMRSSDFAAVDMLRNSSRCDGLLFDETLSEGESVVGTDGTVLRLVCADETIDTPAGTFTNCRRFATRYADPYGGNMTAESYYKEGVGIVKHVHTVDGLSETLLLKRYHIAGGEGLLPLVAGNTWEYANTCDPAGVDFSLTFAVTHAAEDEAIVTSEYFMERLKYNEDSWLDMIEMIRFEYCKEENGRETICDVSHAVARAEALASTPMEKAHTKAAASVVRRIMETDPEFNPDCTATGHWNFFSKNVLLEKPGGFATAHNTRWSFEWKNTGALGDADTPLLFNDVYDILSDATGFLWSDAWRIGEGPSVECDYYGRSVRTEILCADGGCISTKAGTFESCLKLSLNIDGLEDGLSYRAGKKVYYFAEGVGIVRAEHAYCQGAKTAVYDLVSYEGTGEGYMPIKDGLVRRYEAQELTDGFVGAAEYTYVADEKGNVVIFADRTGIRNVPAPITQYSAIQGEIIEDQLWEEGKREESRLRHDVNNFRLLSHFFGRPNRNWAAHAKAAAWNKTRMRIMEDLSGDGEVPPAWWGHYASTCFRTACALFGHNKEETREEGYRYLDRAFVLFEKWESIENGEEMDVGDPMIYGGIKVVKGKGILRLPDGTIEPLDYPHLFQDSCKLMYYGMTATHGWEWFNPVRGEERFQAYVERAREMMEKKK